MSVRSVQRNALRSCALQSRLAGSDALGPWPGRRQCLSTYTSASFNAHSIVPRTACGRSVSRAASIARKSSSFQSCVFNRSAQTRAVTRCRHSLMHFSASSCCVSDSSVLDHATRAEIVSLCASRSNVNALRVPQSSKTGQKVFRHRIIPMGPGFGPAPPLAVASRGGIRFAGPPFSPCGRLRRRADWARAVIRLGRPRLTPPPAPPGRGSCRPSGRPRSPAHRPRVALRSWRRAWPCRDRSRGAPRRLRVCASAPSRCRCRRA